MDFNQLNELSNKLSEKLKGVGVETTSTPGFVNNGQFYNTTNEQELLNKINSVTGKNYTGLSRTSDLSGDYPAEIWRPETGWKSALPTYNYNSETGMIDVTLPDWMQNEGANGSSNVSFYKKNIEPILSKVIGNEVNENDLKQALQDASDKTFYAMMGAADTDAQKAYNDNLAKIDSTDALKQNFVTGYELDDDGNLVEKIETGEDILNRLNAMGRDDFANWVNRTASSLNNIKADNSQYDLLTSRQNNANQQAINYTLLRFADKYVDTGKFAAQNLYEGFVTSMSDSVIGSMAAIVAGIDREQKEKIEDEMNRLAYTANFSFKDDEFKYNNPASLSIGKFTGTLAGVAGDIMLMNLATAGAAGVVSAAAKGLVSNGIGNVGRIARIGNFADKLYRAGGVSEMLSSKILTSLSARWGVEGMANLSKLVKALTVVGSAGAGEALETVEYNLAKITLAVISGESVQKIPTFEEFAQDVFSDLIIGGGLNALGKFRGVRKAQKNMTKELAEKGLKGKVPGVFESIINNAVSNMDDSAFYKMFRRKQQEAYEIIKGQRKINNGDSALKGMSTNQIKAEMLKNNPFKTPTEAATDLDYSVNTPKTRVGTNTQHMNQVLNNSPKLMNNLDFDNMEISRSRGVTRTLNKLGKDFSDGAEVAEQAAKATRKLATADTEFTKGSKKTRQAKVKNVVEKENTAKALAAGQDITKIKIESAKNVSSPKTINTPEDISKAISDEGMTSIRAELGGPLSTKEFNKKFMALPENVQTMIGNYIDKMSNGTKGVNQKTVLEALSNKDIADAVDLERYSLTKITKERSK